MLYITFVGPSLAKEDMMKQILSLLFTMLNQLFKCF